MKRGEGAGTGKTLVARCLAASASRSGRRVAFFMRKGADVLSKWVGEAERQLRLLFEEAQRRQPSIIFFDEIDGLAPVRAPFLPLPPPRCQSIAQHSPLGFKSAPIINQGPLRRTFRVAHTRCPTTIWRTHEGAGLQSLGGGGTAMHCRRCWAKGPPPKF